MGSGDAGGFDAVLNQLLSSRIDARTGDWVTFHLSAQGGRGGYVRFSVVGEQRDRLGRDAAWVEIDFGHHESLTAPMAQLRLLVAKGHGFSETSVTRLILAHGYFKPRELRIDQIARFIRADSTNREPRLRPGAAGKDFAVITGQQRQLMTPAGTLKAVPVEVRYRSTLVKRIWVSPQVPLFQLARLEVPALDHFFEVRDYGTGARSKMVLPGPADPTYSLEPGGFAGGDAHGTTAGASDNAAP